VTSTASDERTSAPDSGQSAADRRWRRVERTAVDELKSREDEMTDEEIIDLVRG
jgi:hypothetical protein